MNAAHLPFCRAGATVLAVLGLGLALFSESASAATKANGYGFRWLHPPFSQTVGGDLVLVGPDSTFAGAHTTLTPHQWEVTSGPSYGQNGIYLKVRWSDTKLIAVGFMSIGRSEYIFDMVDGQPVWYDKISGQTFWFIRGFEGVSSRVRWSSGREQIFDGADGVTRDQVTLDARIAYDYACKMQGAAWMRGAGSVWNRSGP